MSSALSPAVAPAVSSFATLISAQLRAAVDRVVPDAGGFDPQTRLSEHADFQADGLLALAKRLGRPPRELAAEVVQQLDLDAHVAGPGFVNVTLTGAALLERVHARLADPRLGVGRPEAGTTTVLDYSHPNVAKEMHVGHLRSTVIGDALARVLRHLGGTVVAQNHIGDWGTQFGMLLEHGPGPGTLTQRYQAARKRYEADAGFAERSRSRVVTLQAGDPASLAAWQEMVRESERYFAEVYALLGVLLTPADTAGESSYNAALPQLAATLEQLGVATRSDGALCVFFPGLPDVSGPLIVRKRDGGFGYAATDLAALRHRVEALHADRIVYVVDARQATHFRMVFDTARRAGWLPPSVTVVHAAFGTVLGADGRPFKTRSGATVPLSGLLEAAVTQATEIVAGKNPALPAGELAARGREVGIGAVKYADLSTSRGKDYLYDAARMMSLTGNTSVYLQYAHARLRSVLRKAGALPETPPQPQTPSRVLQPAERALALRLDGFADALAEVARTYEPHRLCTYLYGLAQAVTAFYEQCPVLKAPPAVRAERIAWCALTARTLATGLDLLGIAAPEQL